MNQGRFAALFGTGEIWQPSELKLKKLTNRPLKISEKSLLQNGFFSKLSISFREVIAFSKLASFKEDSIKKN